MHYRFDVLKIIDNKLRIEGWIVPTDPKSEVSFEVLDSNKNIVDIKLVRTKREDVANIYAKELVLKNEIDSYFGFDIVFDYVEGEKYNLIITTQGKRIVRKLSREEINNFNSFSHRKFENIINYFQPNTFKRAFEFLIKEGPLAFIKKTKVKMKGLQVDYDYDEWYRLTKTSEDELNRQRNEYKNEFNYLPKFSFVIPIFDTKKRFLISLLNSLIMQTYQNFEICIADATDYNNSKNNPRKVLDDYMSDTQLKDKMKIKYLNDNKSISENTNEALSLATGDYIVLVDHDDELTLDALYEFTKVLNKNNNIKFIYSDEDKIDMASDSYFEPHFKSDFNLDLLLSVNYICHLTCIRKDLVDDLIKNDGSFERKDFNGAQDYDLYLRIANLLINNNEQDKIYHISKVLYHWRCHPDSTAKETSSKDYAFISGKNAIIAFYNNTKLNFNKVRDVENGFSLGLYHTIFEKIINEPLVSVIIPNKDHIEDLRLCITSLKKSIYKNFEIIIVENNSENKKTFDYYDNLKNNNIEEFKDLDIKVVYYDGVFNYSKINNFGVKNSAGEYILLLNNDTEMISEYSIEEMMNYIMRNDVGVVGAKLLYKDDTIQHAGVVIGFGGIAGHTFIGAYDKASTYMNRAQCVQDYNAVTAACLMTKRKLYNDVGGLSEELVVAFNDIDYCMKIRNIGKLVVYNPYAAFYHYESKSRGLEDTKEKIDRFNGEVAIFAKKWNKKLLDGDEYYNPNLTLRKSDFSLRNLQFEKIAEPYKLDDEILKKIGEL